MPLVVLSGYPSSGKSSVVNKLVETLKSSKPEAKVVVVKDEDFGSFNREMYNNSNKEKEARGLWSYQLLYSQSPNFLLTLLLDFRLV